MEILSVIQLFFILKALSIKTMNPRLLTGNPRIENASFTRFVLPFAYQLQRIPYPPLSGPRYEDCTPDEWFCPAMPWEASIDDFQAERLRYLTPETSRVLFQRGRWLTLRRMSEACWENRPKHVDDEGLTLTIKRNDGKSEFDLILRNPGIILMEWNRELERMHQHEKQADLRCPCCDSPRPGAASVPSDNPEYSVACGFLVMEVHFDKQDVSLADLLRVNELMRYWQRPFKEHWQENGGETYPHLPMLKGKEETACPSGSPSYYQELWARWLEYPIHVPSRCRENDVRLIPQSWMDESRRPVRLCDRNEEPAPSWAIHPDNRAHVWTCAVHDGNPALVHRAKKIGRNNALAPEDSTPWLRLLNVDQPYDLITDKLSPFEAKWLPFHTYTRWAHFGTLYGFTPHSGAMLSAPCKSPPAWKHFRIMYFDLALMMLYVRACLFRFSQRLSKLTCRAAKLPPSSPISQENIDAFRALRWEFAQFTSLYQFPLISNQQQAVEMYAELREHMDIQAYYEHVRQEIETIQDFLASEQAAKQTEKTMQLTVVATVGLVLSLILAVLGADVIMDHFKNSEADSKVHPSFIILVGVMALAVSVPLFLGVAEVSRFKAVRSFLDRLSSPRR